jgi:DNA primase
VGEIALEEHGISERHQEKVGTQYKRDKNPYKTAKGALKSLKYNYMLRMLDHLTDDLKGDDEKTRKEAHRMKTEIQREKTRFERYNADVLFPDPDSSAANKVSDKIFSYKMKGEK